VALVPASADRLACTLAPANDLVACLEPVACDDVAAQDACSDAHFAASKDCPIAYPDEVYIIEEVSCFGVPAFTCTSGQQIADYRQCDGSVDCTDGSDEQGCP
jgi:hypothetical protein